MLTLGENCLPTEGLDVAKPTSGHTRPALGRFAAALNRPVERSTARLRGSVPHAVSVARNQCGFTLRRARPFPECRDHDRLSTV